MNADMNWGLLRCRGVKERNLPSSFIVTVCDNLGMRGVDSGWVGEDGEPGRVSAMIRNESSFLEGSRCEFGFEFGSAS